MLLFSRELQLNGAKSREAIAHCTHMAEYVTQTNGVPVNLWTQVYSPAAGTVAFTAFLPDMTALEAAMDKLMVDDGYNDLVETGLQYGIPGTLTDRLGTVVHPTEFAPDDQTPNYVRVIRSTALVSRLPDALQLGVELSQLADAVTGSESLFLVDETGPFVGVTWIYAYADAAEAERFNTQLGTDSRLGDLVGRTRDLFLAGASTRTLYRRIL